MTGKDTDVLPQPRSEQIPSRRRSPAVLPAVMAVQGAAFAVLAGLDGSAGWRVARVLVAVAVSRRSAARSARLRRSSQVSTLRVTPFAPRPHSWPRYTS
jgi:hypothetical protein